MAGPNDVTVLDAPSDRLLAAVRRLLAEKGIKVAVLDVQKLTYEGTPPPPTSQPVPKHN